MQMSVRQASAIMLLVAAAACGNDRVEIQATGEPTVEITEAELVEQLEWMREHQQLINRQIAWMQETSARSAAEISRNPAAIHRPPDPAAAQQMQAHIAATEQLEARRPLNGLAVRAINNTVEAIARKRADATGEHYVKERNETALANARRSFGDAFVDWMLEREELILDKLTGAAP